MSDFIYAAIALAVIIMLLMGATIFIWFVGAGFFFAAKSILLLLGIL